MHGSFGQRGGDGDERLERAIVLLLLEDGHPRAWSRGQLAAALEADPPALERALDSLTQAGVLDLAGADVRVSRAARRIDELGLIGI
jgi:DNA-binding transcriptional ArsR family regulator